MGYRQQSITSKMENNRPRKKSVVVLGAGLAGLAAGYELTRAGFTVHILEKEPEVGGLAKTISKNGFKFDTGPHRWYTKNDMVNRWMLDILKNEIIRVPRLTRIYFDKKFFHYPIKLKSTLQGMGLVKTIMALIDYIFVRIRNVIHKNDALTLEEGYINKFGNTLYQLFFRRYSEKLWGTSCKNISADWIGQRTRGFNFGTIIKDIIFQKRDVVSFVDEFSYPKSGIGRIAEKMAEEIRNSGGSITTESEVIKIEYKDNHIQSVHISSKDKTSKVLGNEFISSIPLKDLIERLLPGVPTDIAKKADKLGYRDELQVALFIKRIHITPDTWVYIHSLNLPFVRFMEMDNWSPNLSPKGTTTLVFEIACSKGDEMWNKTDNEIVALTTETFIKEFGLVQASDIIGSYVHRMEKEYPVYHIGYRDDLAIIRKYLGNFRNLQLVGRNGLHRYNNMDHSIEMGLYAAWNVIEGERRFDVDSVNIEREYLEEKRVNVLSPELAEDQYVEEEKH